MNSAGLYPLLENAAHQWPKRTAITWSGGELTFDQLDDAVRLMARQLRDHGIGPGQKVGLLCSSGPSYVIGSFALFLMDGIVVPIFPGLKPSEIDDLTNALGIDAICYDPVLEPALETFIPAQPWAIISPAPGLDFKLCDRVRGGPDAPTDRRLSDIGAPLLRFTSGTTSAAKGVIIPQSAMLEYTKRFASAYSIAAGDGILNLLSMAHIFYQVPAALLTGARLFVYEINDLENILGTIRTGCITHIEAAPNFYASLLRCDSVGTEHFAPMKHITTCGTALPDSVAAQFRRRFGREIVQRYGLTETGPVIINLSEEERHRGTLGRTVPSCEIRLEPLDSDRDGHEGEVLVRCPGLFHGYYLPWTPADCVLDDGWYHTGDIAQADDDGYIRLVGRIKNMINVGAVKVFPAEIEHLLCQHPAVEEALVYGAPDRRFGEVPRAKVKLSTRGSANPKEILAWANQRLSVFAALRQIEVVDGLPKTLTGKLKRTEVSNV